MTTYQEILVDGPFDPVLTVAHLASSGLLGEHVVYERERCWHVAARPLGEIRVDARQVHSGFDGSSRPWSGTPWKQVALALAEVPVPGWNAYGWAGFELASGTGAEGETLAHLIVPRLELRVREERILVRALDRDVLDSVRTLLGEAATEPSGVPAPVATRAEDSGYRAAVAHTVAEIGRGRLEKAILSRAVTVPYTVDLPATYVRGRRGNTPARSFLLDLGGWQAAGFSPETVIEVDPTGTASTQPLAGTRARTGDPGTDAVLREQLLADPKEVFEHALSVRLAVEELSGVGREGSTRVEEFMAVKERGSVQHLGSRVTTQLSRGRTAWDALGAVFPPVTASGIPKAAAYRLIAELEGEPRGLYSGTVLMASHDGSLDAALVLRAVYRRDGRCWLRAGAGVVGASRPAREYEETCEKLAAVAPYTVPTT
ncbi:salicylate synthase [Kitasatospora paracochleata]|uniref:Salicylate synthetase n=1 Tax=Kitasatospora paracochleata TaxID=58354 RepID=A0ABT1IWG8_9ACTN|nr:salicylate synthase [Kitasatospora paracochleata]MCP2309472.1 salicylate synthetase [Kitasatospora paracochleata]